MRFMRAFSIVTLMTSFFFLFLTDVSFTGAVIGQMGLADLDMAFWSALTLLVSSFVIFFVDMRRSYGADENTRLGKLLKKTDYSIQEDSRIRDVESIVMDTIQKEYADVNSIGSSYRQTYVPGKADIDLYIHTDDGLRTLMQKSPEFAGVLEKKLEGVYGSPVEVRLRKAENDEGLNKVFYTIYDSSTGKELMKIDTNYSAKEGVKDYNLAFGAQAYNITSALPPAQREQALEYLKANIRGLKGLLEDNGLYKPKNDGLSGLAVEQLFLQMGGTLPRDLESFREKYSVGSALRYLDMTREGLSFRHPLTGDEVIPENYSFEKVRSLTRQSSDYAYHASR